MFFEHRFNVQGRIAFPPERAHSGMPKPLNKSAFRQAFKSFSELLELPVPG